MAQVWTGTVQAVQKDSPMQGATTLRLALRPGIGRDDYLVVHDGAQHIQLGSRVVVNVLDPAPPIDASPACPPRP